MSKNPATIPDAWDADWEQITDKEPVKPNSGQEPTSEKKPSSKVTKAQRRAAQAEFNRQLWTDAESPQVFHFLDAKSSIPLKQEYRTPVTVLSRRPQVAAKPHRNNDNPDTVAEGSPRHGIPNQAELAETDEEDNSKAPIITAEERHAKALRDREEKQRKYEEVRERLFGSSSNPGSGASSPRSTTPPARQAQNGDGGRTRGRTRGAVRDRDSRDTRESSGASSKSRQLYDPGYSAKPNSSYVQRRERHQPQSADILDSEPTTPHQPIRSPRGPDGSGRGGFGFSHRGRGG